MKSCHERGVAGREVRCYDMMILVMLSYLLVSAGPEVPLVSRVQLLLPPHECLAGGLVIGMQPLASDGAPDNVLDHAVAGEVPGIGLEESRHSVSRAELCALVLDHGDQGLLGHPLHGQLFDVVLHPVERWSVGHQMRTHRYG